MKSSKMMPSLKKVLSAWLNWVFNFITIIKIQVKKEDFY